MSQSGMSQSTSGSFLSQNGLPPQPGSSGVSESRKISSTHSEFMSESSTHQTFGPVSPTSSFGEMMASPLAIGGMTSQQPFGGTPSPQTPASFGAFMASPLSTSPN